MKKFTITADQMGKILVKAGLSDSDEFKALTEGEADAELTQDQFDKITSGLLNIEDAKKHPEVTKAIINEAKGKIFAPTEDAMKAMLKSEGMDEADIKKLLDGKTNAEKITAALAHIKSLVDSDKSKTKEQREKEWEEKEKAFNERITELDTAVKNEQAGRHDDRVNTALERFVSNKENYTLIDTIPLPTQLRLIREDIRRTADAKGAILTTDATGELTLMDKEDPTKPYHVPGSTEAAKPKEFFHPVIDALGFINKQPGENRKESFVQNEQHQPNSRVVASRNTNFQQIQKIAAVTPES